MANRDFLRTVGSGLALLLIASACGGGEEDVSTGQAPTPFPTLACPELADVPASADPRLAAYTDDDFASLVDQRAPYDLCDVPADHLFDDPRSIDLYEEHGIALLPEEEQYWLEYQARYQPAREVVEQMRTRPGFFKAQANVRAGTVTVWVTEESIDAFRDQGEQAGALAGLDLQTVRYDSAQMESLRDELLSQLAAETRDAIIDVDFEPDRLVIEVDEADPSLAEQVAEAVAAAEGNAARAAGVEIEVEVRLTERNVASTELCPDRDRCAPVGGGLALRLNVGGACSTGPPVVDPNGRRALSTAGHCVDGDVETTNLQSNRNDTNNAPSGSPALGFPVIEADYEDGGNRDFGAVYRDVHEHLVQNVVRRDDVKPLNEVRGSLAPIDDEMVCLSGRNSAARRCGPITEESTSADYDSGISLEDLAEVDLSGNPSADGDSGGAWTVMGNDDMVIGIHSGGSVDGSGEAYVSVNLPVGWSYFLGDSAEFGGAQVRNAVVTFYDSGLFRSPDFGGLDYWSNRVGAASSCLPEIRTVNRNFLALTEFRSSLPPPTVDNLRRRVRRLFWTGLDRDVDSTGLNFWVDEVGRYQSDGLNAEQAWTAVVRRVTGSSEATTRYSRACQRQ